MGTDMILLLEEGQTIAVLENFAAAFSSETG
jgi:hypothetical protein